MKKITYLLILFIINISFAQDDLAIVKNYLTKNRIQLELEPEDIADISFNKRSFSKSMQLTNMYVLQRYRGIEIFNSTSNIAIKQGKVVHAKFSFNKDVSEKINAINPVISASIAVKKATEALNVKTPNNLTLIETPSKNSYLFNTGDISLENIPVKLVFQPMDDAKLRLAWDLSIYLLDATHYYSVRIDALTGELLSENDWVVNCTFSETTQSKKKAITKGFFESSYIPNASFVAGEQYRVFPLPLESPNEGTDVLVIDPADVVASPFGWHDTDGVAGAEFTTTKGNNVDAKDDLGANNRFGSSPDGGATLNFDFPYIFNTHPSNMLDALTVNLFYWNNIVHDVWYQYGFDEASGNFQENNYDNGGEGSDSVNADAQDGSGTNNANFSTPPDGINPRMQMFIWAATGPPGQPLTVNNGALAGDYTGVPAQFGPPLSPTPLTVDLVLIEDDNSFGESIDPNDGCDVIINRSEIDGKIAVIRRGACEFGFKVSQAQLAGAVAVIVVNNEPGDPISMGPGEDGAFVNIPSIMVSQADGAAIIAKLQIPETVNVSLTETAPFPTDSDLDNGIITHEYGHGISTRLTGGAANSDCLDNDEQMGEGWSDWFGLMLTIKASDQPGDARPIGTYVDGTTTGIRPAPYSTDFAVNNFTYANSNSGVSVPHGVGFVWATMLWDLTWAFVDQYGFDPDFYNGTGGNNMVMQLVIDGLKLQNCNPGFVDGRDAILQADLLANGGVNSCLIWGVFANRGLGASASQGESTSRSDQVEAFDLPAECGVLDIENQELLDNNFVIYPNPSNSNVTIKSLINVGDVSISIFDINGRTVYSKESNLTNDININTENLRTGVYILKIQNKSFTYANKLIIQ